MNEAEIIKAIKDFKLLKDTKKRLITDEAKNDVEKTEICLLDAIKDAVGKLEL